MSESRRDEIRSKIIEHTGIDEAMIERLVRSFYARTRDDELLGPVFATHITDWEAHLQKMCVFWSSVALMTGRFHGSPMEKHLTLPIDARHFDRWLELFEHTARTVCPSAAADHFMERARRIAESLELGIAASYGVLPAKGQRFIQDDLILEKDNTAAGVHPTSNRHDEDAPVSFASPPCFMHELNPDYSGIADTSDRNSDVRRLPKRKIDN